MSNLYQNLVWHSKNTNTIKCTNMRRGVHSLSKSSIKQDVATHLLLLLSQTTIFEQGGIER